MKFIKVILITFLFFSLTNVINAQDVVKELSRKEKRALRKKKKTQKISITINQKKDIVPQPIKKPTQVENNTLCDFYNKIYANYKNDYQDIKGERSNDDGIFKQWKSTIEIPKDFIKYYIDSEHRVFNLTKYNGVNLEEANRQLEKLYNDWYACRFGSNKEFQFIKEDNQLNSKIKKRTFYLTTTTDNLLIKFNLFQNYEINKKTRKIETVYNVSLGFIRLKDKQKAINRILK